MTKEIFVEKCACEPRKPRDLASAMTSDFPSKEKKSFPSSIFSETRLNYGLAGCGSSSISCQITPTFTHEQAFHPISCKRQSPEISALDRSSNVALPLFILAVSLSSRLFFFHLSLWSFQANDFPVGDARPILEKL